MSTNKLRQLALAIKMLTQRDNLNEALMELGLSPQELKDLLEVVLEQGEVHELIIYEPKSTVSGRIFSPWERLVLSVEAQRFLLSALHTEVITPSELEQTLALLVSQTHGFAGVEEVCSVLEGVIQDQLRMAVLTSSNLEHIH